MAQVEASPVIGRKRGPGRPSRASESASKKRKTGSPAPVGSSSANVTPVLESPSQDKPSPRLPYRITDNRPLPSLSEAQPVPLADTDYQSIASSTVLHTSLDRSRLRWVCDGVFERYWTKPETGKNARPPPPNNPEVKWQKHQGPCRIRIEPHILEAEMFVEQKPKPVPQVKQYIPPAQLYRPGPTYAQQHQPQTFPQRPMTHMQQQQTHFHAHQNTLPPIKNTNHHVTQPQQPPSRAQQPSPTPLPLQQQQQQQDKKMSPDPVISMLANRASSDPELKALMKEVATGNATQDQLKVFQGHIDELTKLVNDKKRKEEEEEAARNARSLQNETIQYDGQAEAAPAPQPKPPQQPLQQQAQPAPTYRAPPPPPPPPPPQQYQQPAPPPPPPSPQPVIFAFTSPGATEDRFLFPQHSILESLSPQHLLASFIVTRTGRQSADPTGLDPDTEYWQPVTLMIEVAYKREHFLQSIKRWVKPADEVRQHMEEIIKRCTKAPDAFLALRLPFKGSTMAETDDMVPELAAPFASNEDRSKPRSSNVKYVKKALSKPAPEGTPSAPAKADASVPATPSTSAALSVSESTTKPGGTGQDTIVNVTKAESEEIKGESAAEPTDESATATNENGRPRRALRKSVRISES